MDRICIWSLITSFMVLCSLPLQAATASGNWEVVLTAGVTNVETASFINAKDGVICGVGGKAMFGTGEDVPPIAYTRDGGSTWKTAWVDRPTIKEVLSIQLLSATHGVALGNDPEGIWLLKTTDGGLRWTSTQLPKDLRATRVFFLTAQDGWAFTPWASPPHHALHVTSDGGQTWRAVDIGNFRPKPDWNPAVFAPRSKTEFYLGGNFDYLLHTVDGGVTFTTTTIPYRGSREFLNAFDISIAPDGRTIYIAGGQASDYVQSGWRSPKQAVIVKSADGGNTWETLDPGVVNCLRCIRAVSADEVWAGGFGGYGLPTYVPGVLLHSKNGGKTWENASPSHVSIRGMTFLQPDLFWAVGGQGGSPYEAAGAVICHRPEPEGARTKGTIPIRYTMPADGYASLALADANGQQVRTLLAHARRKAGPQMEWWDGLDDDGLPLPAGTYTCKLLTHRGITANFLMAYNSPSDPPYVTPDGKGGWIGDHGAPMAVAAVEHAMIIGFGGGESLPAISVVDLEGRKTGINGKGWPVALATDGKYAYVISESFTDYTRKNEPQAAMETTITRWEVATGRFAYYEQQQESRVIHRWTLDQTAPDKFLSDRIRQTDFTAEFSGHACNDQYIRTTNACGVAFGDGKLYVTLRKENTVLILDAATCQRLGQISVPAPVGIAFADGILYVVSETRVLRFSDPAKPGTAVVENLEAPFGLAVSGDRLYVSDWGGSMQVKAYTRDGKPLGTIGKRGGRPWLGKHDPTGMLKPRGLAVDAHGRVWVAEDDEPIKRVSIWNADGTLYKELIGAGRYASYSFMYPDDMHTAYVNTYGVTSFAIDLEKKSWQPEAILCRDGYDPRMLNNTLPFFATKAKDGRTLYLTSARSMILSIAEKREERLHPILSVGWAPQLVPPDVQQGWNQPYNPFMRGQRTDHKWHGAWSDEHHDKFCVWVDANRDGLYQPEEIQFVTPPGWDTSGTVHNPPGTTYWGQWIAPDLTLYLVTALTPGQIWRWPLAGWDANGLPVYRQEDLQLVCTMPTKTTGAITVGPGGNIVIEGDLSAVSPQGTPLWRYPHHWSGMAFQAPFGRPGLVVGTQVFCGWVDDLFMVNGYFGQFNVLTEDGLYVTQFLNDLRSHANAGAYSVTVENFSGLWLRDPKTRDVYLLVGGAGDSRIFRIDGLETIKRASSTTTVTPAQMKEAHQAAMAQTAPSTTAAPKTATVVRTACALAIPGELDNAWKALAPIVEVKDSQSTGYTVRAAHDGTHLYLAYEVSDSSPMVNQGDNFRQLFKSGDVVDFMFGPAVQHTQPVAGDLRLLMSVMDGKPVSVLYRPVKLTGQDAAPATFASPSRKIPMERVTQEEGVEMNVLRNRDGYLVKTRIPFTLLGLSYAPGVKVTGDFGVVYSDVLGSRNIYRSYWANRDPSLAIVNDIPSEAMLSPGGWAELSFE
jgi:YVTN family beta-propeller protein